MNSPVGCLIGFAAIIIPMVVIRFLYLFMTGAIHLW